MGIASGYRAGRIEQRDIRKENGHSMPSICMGVTASGQLPFLRPSYTLTSKSNAINHHSLFPQPVPTLSLSMLQHHCPPALVPLREHDAAVSALVLHVLETGDEVRHAAETEDDTCQRGPCTTGTLSAFSFLSFTRFQLVRLAQYRVAWGEATQGEMYKREGKRTGSYCPNAVPRPSGLAVDRRGSRQGRRLRKGLPGGRRFGMFAGTAAAAGIVVVVVEGAAAVVAPGCSIPASQAPCPAVVARG